MARRSKFDITLDWMMRAVTYAIVGAVAYIVVHIVWNGLPALNWEFVSSFPRDAGAKGGILPAIVGTACLIVGTLIVALPLGMACAIYLSEYSKQGSLSRLIRMAIITLAGIPSIVFGLFGLAVFVLLMGFGASILSGSLTLACMVLPTIIVASEEALRAVPRSMREGSLALGATQWYTIYKNVLPYALPGMITGSVLAIGRAAGETAPILFTAAAFFLPRLPQSIYDPIMALPYHLYILSTQQPDPAAVHAQRYGTALMLLLLVLSFSVSALVLRYRIRKRYQW